MSTYSRKTCRSGRRCEIQSLADAIECVAHHSDLPLRELAERIGRSPDYLRAACNPYDDTHRFQAHLIVALTAASGNFAIVDYIEWALHRVAFSLPLAPGPGELFDHTADIVHKLGASLEAIRAATKDGRITADEADHVRHHIYEVHSSAAALEACIVAQVEPADRQVI